MEIMTDEFIEKVKLRINQMGIKKSHVAKQIGITEVYLSYILNEKRRLTDDVKTKLQKYLGL